MQDEETTDLDELQWILQNGSWQPLLPPKLKYPRLVRENYTDPIYPRRCEDIEVINALSRLLRNEPKSPGEWVMKDIIDLTAKVGPAISHQENTLEEWLNLAHLVKAQLEARKSLDLAGYDAMCEDIDHWAHEFQAKPHVTSNIADLKNPYLPLFSSIVFVNEKGGSRRAERFSELNKRKLRAEISTLQVWDTHFASSAPLRCWVSYQLAYIWDAGAKVLECKGCKQPFYARREGKAHCSSTCRVLRFERDATAPKD